MTASLRPARLIIIHLNIGLSVYSLFDLMFSLATIPKCRYVYIPPCLRNIMDGHTPPTEAQARMMNLEGPCGVTLPNGDYHDENNVFTNGAMPYRVFIELPVEEAEQYDVKKYRGRTTGGEIIGVTGSEYLIHAPTVVVTNFVDVTDIAVNIEWKANNITEEVRDVMAERHAINMHEADRQVSMIYG